LDTNTVDPIIFSDRPKHLHNVCAGLQIVGLEHTRSDTLLPQFTQVGVPVLQSFWNTF
jgi:hypothetical protein